MVSICLTGFYFNLQGPIGPNGSPGPMGEAGNPGPRVRGEIEASLISSTFDMALMLSNERKCSR